MLPKHVAIIPDGNRRWAKEKGLPTFAGHKRGFENAVKLARHIRKLGIHTLTLWGFSTENWNRAAQEKNYLFKIFLDLTDTYLQEAKKDKVRIIHLGRKDRLPTPLVDKIKLAETETRSNDKYFLNLAMDYGGQDEVLRAIKKFVRDVGEKKVRLEDLDKPIGQYQQKYPYYLFKNYLDTADQPHPYPDLVIRTSGEQRLSGYLLWQSVYSELYFAKVHFPDFTPSRFDEVLSDYTNRQRRFGGS